MRRAVLFFVLLAVFAVLIVYLVKLKNEPAPAVSISAGPASSTPADVPSAAVSTEPAATPSPTAHAIPSATAPPTAAPLPATPAPDWTQGEAGELVVRLDGEDRHVPGFEREYILQEDPLISFCLLVPGEVVEPRYGSNAWYFPLAPQGGGDADRPAWLELSRITGATAEELLPDFMSAYLSFTEIEFSGASTLGEVGMDETITASGDDLFVKAWLLDVPQGVFSVVLCCASDRLDPDLSYLEAMLDTLRVAVEK